MILKIALGLIGLGVVVFFHELGHFLAAKLMGIEVEAFSIGWGKTLLSYKWRGTEYRLSVLPLGGYCKLKGEEAMKSAWESGSKNLAPEKGSFYGASPWRRIFVAASGPALNFLFAIAAFSLVWLIGFSYPTFPNRIILESDFPTRPSEAVYPAAEAGLRSGDYITAVETKTVANYRDLQETVAGSPGKPLRITYTRADATGSVTVVPDLNRETGTGRIGVYAWIEPVVDTVRKDSSAYIGGIKKGDRILTVNDKEVPHTLYLMRAVSESKSSALRITYMRDGRISETGIIPHADEAGRPDIGVTFRPTVFSSRRVGPVEALALGVRETADTLGMTVKSLGLLFKGIDLSQAVSGPLRITYYVGEVAAQGFSRDFSTGVTSVLNFLSLLSVALFFMNLLPIPALDGGLILLFFFEGLIRKPLNPRFIYRYQYVGIFFILLLIILSTMSDMFYFFRK